MTHTSRPIVAFAFGALAAIASSAQSAPIEGAATPAASSNTLPHALPSLRDLAGEARTDRPIPPIVKKWAAAWESSDAAGMAKLFTADGVYDDFAFQARSTGPAGIAMWVNITGHSLPGAKADILDVFQSGDRIAIRWMFNATPAKGNPLRATGRSFSVPVVTVLALKGGLIQRDSDYYNLADVLRQLGLPAGPWTPPAS